VTTAIFPAKLFTVPNVLRTTTPSGGGGVGGHSGGDGDECTLRRVETAVTDLADRRLHAGPSRSGANMAHSASTAAPDVGR
jgi:hypothetical protein